MHASLSRSIKNKSTECWQHSTAVKNHWKVTRARTCTGELDRKKLGKLIFESPQLRRKLNEATHPLVTMEMVKQIIWHWLCFKFVVVMAPPILTRQLTKA